MTARMHTLNLSRQHSDYLYFNGQVLPAEHQFPIDIQQIL